ncbi:MAG TPA: tetratricopeptide repeat protein, partial [Nannocystaceae bacterium]|nr:tetratricopeptide repeat protein [Nannocystaceae bacterium]
RTASARSNLANVRMDAGELEPAAALYRKAIATAETTDGVDHPDVAVYLTNLGNVLIELGELDEAQQVIERALAIRERALGEDHPDLVFTLMSLGGVHLTAERPGEAVPLLERALVIVDRGQSEPLAKAAVRFELGQAVALAGGDRARAQRLVDEAEVGYRELGPAGARYLEQVEQWRRENR